jgi:hypothetical protein
MLARRRNAYRARSVRDSATTLTATSMHSWSSGPAALPPKALDFFVGRPSSCASSPTGRPGLRRSDGSAPFDGRS